IAMIGWQANRLSPGNFVSLLVIAILFYQVSSAINVSRNPRSTIADEDQPTAPFSRQSIGATAALIGGFTAWRALDNDSLRFPSSAGWVIALGGIAALAAIW